MLLQEAFAYLPPQIADKVFDACIAPECILTVAVETVYTLVNGYKLGLTDASADAAYWQPRCEAAEVVKVALCGLLTSDKSKSAASIESAYFACYPAGTSASEN